MNVHDHGDRYGNANFESLRTEGYLYADNPNISACQKNKRKIYDLGEYRMEEKVITVQDGSRIWKAHLEFYHNEAQLRGFPYFRITEVDDVCYLWQLDPEHPESCEYVLIKTGTDYSALRKEAMERETALCRELYPERFRRPFSFFSS